MNSGKRLSYVDLLVNENLRIEIPMIQRDYAQEEFRRKKKGKFCRKFKILSS